MNHRWFALALVAAPAVLWAVGCGDDEDSLPGTDGGLEAAVDSAVPDAAPSGCGDSTGAPSRLLLTINGIGDGGLFSEVAAFDVNQRTVSGRYSYLSKFGTTYALGTDPYVLAQEQSFVVRLDPKEPWKPVATWDVLGDDVPDSGRFSQPTSVAVPSCGKGYVARFERNRLAVIDTTAKPDAGPTKYIDLSAFKQANDTDGRVEATAAIYVPGKKLLYVLLGGIDISKVAGDGFTALCADTKPSIIGIDVEKDEVVSLNGAGPGGAILLEGYSPVVGPASFLYDAAQDRLLVLEAGCNTPLADAGAGPVVRRRVEQVQLRTGAVSTLLDLGEEQFPLGLVYLDETRAALSVADVNFTNHAFFWNPQSTSLGAEIPGGLESLTHDGAGNVVGARAATTDAGRRIEVVRIPYTDAGAVDAASLETLGVDPFSSNGGFLNGADLWPRP